MAGAAVAAVAVKAAAKVEKVEAKREVSVPRSPDTRTRDGTIPSTITTAGVAERASLA
jgi:hypothetical protein